jgi:two-component system copper resistance phosphate regulon response regulator CusR
VEALKRLAPKQHVLVVEDDRRMLDLLCNGLREAGHTSVAASDGGAALELAMNFSFDSIILDIGLPVRDGYSVARCIRAVKSVPILMLTARDGEDDILRGFDHGADDYLTKPFSFRELLARLNGLSRTVGRYRDSELQLDASRLVVHRDQVAIELTRSEYLLLKALHRHLGFAVDRHTLREAVWGSLEGASDNALEVLINGLRLKIDAPFQNKLLVTVRGVGYRLLKNTTEKTTYLSQ